MKFPSTALLATPAQLELRPGDHISIMGNTLSDRLQHEGTLEAMLLKGGKKTGQEDKDGARNGARRQDGARKDGARRQTS